MVVDEIAMGSGLILNRWDTDCLVALRYARQLAQETSGEVVYGLGRQPAVLQTFSQRLCRGFNDAINGFSDDGWSMLSSDGAEDVINSRKNLATTSVWFLWEHCSEWANFNVDAYVASSSKSFPYSYPGMRPTRFTESQITMPLGHIIDHEEMLEVIRLEGHSIGQEDAFMPRDIHLLQDTLNAHRTLDLASSLEVGAATNPSIGDAASCYSARPVLTIAFQFPFEDNLQENVATMSRHYHMGMELLQADFGGDESVLKNLWQHQDAILYSSLKPSDAASGSISPMDARRSCDDIDPNEGR
ncbi:hypothetical protein BC332_23431 [Capsicum chinense]|nr:hypothetical protein BC332_23431 [Capsicum chinense]